MNIGDLFDVDLLNEMKSQKYVKETEHPSEPYSILNYSPAAQYDKVWNEVTLQCRGLIVNHKTGEVVARPFRKFFNLGEVVAPPEGPFRVTDKADGSLGIAYRKTDGSLAISTRGSFQSEQALHATEVLRRRYPGFDPAPGLTYLFEIIYPNNRIVLDYGDQDDLILLDVLHTDTGQQAVDYAWGAFPGPWIDVYDGEYASLSHLLAAPERPNKEGFVLIYEDGTRLKVKHEWYVAMHAIVTNTSSRTIWEFLSQGRDMSLLLDNVPDEFSEWARTLADSLTFEFENTKATVTKRLQYYLDGLPIDALRKDFAQAFANDPYRGLLFLALDGKSLDDQIWKRHKPERTLPFRDMEEAA